MAMRNGEYELVVALEEYPGKKYRGKYCYEHHLVYWRRTGVVPKSDEVVHHENRNKRDNRFENLELKKKGKHNSEHNRERGRQMARLRCPNCGCVFEREYRQTHLTKGSRFTSCSRTCGLFLTGKYFGVGKVPIPKDVQKRIDDNVIEIFRLFPSS